jgi:haloacetate dehalogenase
VFEGFAGRRVASGDADLFVRVGGSGPPLLLLHGYPQTHAMWHAVAPRLARRFTLVLPDLRGYGESRGPKPDPEHRGYSKRVMAEDARRVVAALGHTRFFVAGHDRGGRVAYRLALDRPECVAGLAVLDILPTLEQWERMDWRGALTTFHWPFLAQPAPVPERLIGQDPDFWARYLLERWAGRRDALDPAAVEAYLRAFRQPTVIEATCEDYRAGADVDVEDDRADRQAGRRIGCPTLVIWGRRYLAAKAESPAEVWRAWAEDVGEVALDCGHFVAEEEPEACARALEEFFGRLR